MHNAALQLFTIVDLVTAIALNNGQFQNLHFLGRGEPKVAFGATTPAANREPVPGKPGINNIGVFAVADWAEHKKITKFILNQIERM